MLVPEIVQDGLLRLLSPPLPAPFGESRRGVTGLDTQGDFQGVNRRFAAFVRFIQIALQGDFAEQGGDLVGMLTTASVPFPGVMHVSGLLARVGRFELVKRM